MAKQQIDIGVEGNDGTGDSIRESFRKVNENFTELYAVFGIGGQISFTDLSDVPGAYDGQENKLLGVKDDGSGLSFKDLVSDSALNPADVDTILFDYSIPDKIVIKVGNTRIANDPQPVLGGPLNAGTQGIGNVSVTDGAADTFNAVHGTSITVNDLVIDKKFADRNYQTKEVAGGGIRLEDEPADRSFYTKTITAYSSGNAVIPGHGLDGAYNGAPFVYNSTGTDSANVVSGGTYYLRYIDANTISLHTSETDAINNTGKRVLGGGTGTQTIADAAYDETLTGNWLDNVALPRKSIVRRQGDEMEGLLYLSDHPGELSGQGTPNGPSDLQAATKLYVDAVAAPSQTNLYVSTSGSDKQRGTPAGQEGRSSAYAYASINAAARKAEEIIEAAGYEPGPYMQTMTYNVGEAASPLVASGVTNPIANRSDASALLQLNREWIQKEVIGYVNATYPDFEYDTEICERDVGLIIDSVALDIQFGNNANYLSRWAGIRYYSSPSALKAIGDQRTETIDAINHAKALASYVVQNLSYPTTYQVDVTQTIDGSYTPDVNAQAAVETKFDVVLDVINDGVLNAPTIIDGQSTYRVNVSNGNFGYIDQGDPENTDIIPGKVIRGKESGAIGRIIRYTYESDPATTVSISETDEFEVQLLEPIEFIQGEEIEYGNIVRETQVTIFVESGIYYEDYPIKVPANVSVKGDEFRRSIIRPKDRISQSRYANTYFYRDREFDNLVLGRSDISEIGNFTGHGFYSARAHAGPDPIEYTVTNTEWTTDGFGEDAVFTVSIDTNGGATVTVTNPGSKWRVTDEVIIPDSAIGNNGAPDLTFQVTQVPNGTEYVNPLTGEIDGYFGYHYLKNPGAVKNVGAGYSNVGGYTNAALILEDNKEFIQEQVIEYANAVYPAIIGTYSEPAFSREIGLIVDSLIEDFTEGGNEFALESQGKIIAGTGNDAASKAAIEHIYTIGADIFAGNTPTLYGSGLEYPAPDLTNGTGESGTTVLLQNLIDTVAFKYDANYNPPLNNLEMDAFLMNDASLLRNMTVQGHGGFMLVLDPDGQVLTKSPYIQTGSSFSQSANEQAFRGGMYIDGFTGNTAVNVYQKDDPFTLYVSSNGSQADPEGLFVRRPQTPAPFYVDGRRFQVNAVRNYDPEQGTAELLLDKGSNNGDGFAGLTSTLSTGVDLDSIGTFEFDKDKCARDTGLILDAVGYDIVTGSNFHSVYAGIAYQRATGLKVQNDQLQQTLDAIAFARDEVLGLAEVSADPTATSRATNGFNEIIDITENGDTSTTEPGDGVADAINYPVPGVLPTTDADDAATRLQNNRTFIANDVVAYVNNNTPPAGYDQAKCARDVRFIVDALTYDVLYGGNTGTIISARAYLDGAASQLPADQRQATLNAYTHLQSIVADIITGVAVTPQAGNASVVNTSGANATATESAITTSLIDIIKDVIEINTLDPLPDEVVPDFSWAANPLETARDGIRANRQIIINVTVESINAVIPITIQTAGNRSMLGNDFTQVNDLGYGLVVNNSGLSEMVSMFTYYCWTSYYSRNGSEIRSLTGSSCYGEYGLVAEGSDPNEIPDTVSLGHDMVQPGKAFTADVILYLSGPVSVTAGETVEQITTGTNPTGTVALSTSGNTMYLTDVTGVFNLLNEIEVVGVGARALGANSVPRDSDVTGYTNAVELLSLYVYDLKESPGSRGEFDLYHPVRGAFARYELANAQITDAFVGRVYEVGAAHTPYAYTNTTPVNGPGTGVRFTIDKSEFYGYEVSIAEGSEGTNYDVGDTFVVDGTYLGGSTPANDATITVTSVDPSTFGITGVTITGTVDTTARDVPKYSGQVYQLNQSTSDAQFSQNGLLEAVEMGTFVNVRRNQTFIFSDINAPDILTIRPSTAVIFDEAPQNIYRSISFASNDSVGNDLGFNQSLAGFDSTFDYVRAIVDPTRATGANLDGDPGTMGASGGDTLIAIQPIPEFADVNRINNNILTPESNRPPNWTLASLVDPLIITWEGKKHAIYNYRGVDSGGNFVAPSEDNTYAVISITDLENIDVGSSSTGLRSPVVLGGETIILRAGLQVDSPGTITVNISTCRATGHDFLDVGTGGFNSSNYPNVIFGVPREKDQAKEVEERTKGRVFYVSTDQDGIFRVGRFFSVDQGTGTVSFAASIALSDVDGIGFKRGVVVTEFSTDTAMTDNASDTVPTESAVRGYVNRRLGFDSQGQAISNIIGPGVLAPNGVVPMTADLNAASNTITNLKAPSSDSDAANKAYVDAKIKENDTVNALRDTEVNDIDANQLLVATGYKRIVIDTGSILGGVFEPGDNFTGSLSGAQGTIKDVQETIGIEGPITIITYTPTSGTISSGPPLGQDVISVTAGPSGTVIDGPDDEWANGVWSSGSDLTFTATRNEVTSVDGGGNTVVDSRSVELDVQINSNTIINADVNANAAISQSKLNLNAATTRANATGISQSDLGVAAFDEDEFKTTNGYVELKTATSTADGIDAAKLEWIATDTVLGRSAAGNGPVSAIDFSTIVGEGGGLEDGDFTATVNTSGDPGEALIKTGAGTYGVTNVTVGSEAHSILKTQSDGSIRVDSLRLGGDDTYQILSLDSTEVIFKTPGQGVILTATGGSAGSGGSPTDPGYVAPTYPDIEIPGNVNIGSVGVSESVLQAASNFTGEPVIAVDWVYSSFIEAAGEKSTASTGIALGANTGKTTAGQVAILTADTDTSSTVAPFTFSSTGVVPDVTETYDIGSSTLTYNRVYAAEFIGGVSGNSSGTNKVKVKDRGDTDSTHYLTFVDSNNSPNSVNESVYTDGSLSFNPSTNILTTDIFAGNLDGSVLNSDGTTILAPGSDSVTASLTGEVSSIANHTTNELTEGSDNSLGESSPGAGDGTNNLYFTTARVDAHLSGGTGVGYSTGTISIGQPVETNSNVQFNDITIDGSLKPGTNLPISHTDNIQVDIETSGVDKKAELRLIGDRATNSTNPISDIIFRNAVAAAYDAASIEVYDPRADATQKDGRIVFKVADNGTLNEVLILDTTKVGTFKGDLQVDGNLTVSGTTTTINTTEINLGDNFITFNGDLPNDTAPSEDAGLIVNRGSSDDVSIRWSETSDTWVYTKDGSTYDEILRYGDLSVTSNTASGGGTLSYSSGTFTYTPPDLSNFIALSSLSVGSEGTASGDGAISYDNSTGEFTYTPPLNITGNAATANKTSNTVAAGSTVELVRGNMATNDQFRILVGGASNAGYAEIATADDGTEPIYVRQYNGVFTSVARTLTLLDGSGNTTTPGSLTVGNGIFTSTAGKDIGASGTRFGTVFAGTFDGTATEAFYADLAENYLGDAAYEPGTVLVFGGDEEVTVCSKKGDTRVAGIVTTNPAHLMNSHLKGEHVVGVALTGRVPCKVIGKVSKGDMLVTSAVPGYAIVNNEPGIGQVIGKAVGTKDTEERGIVEVVVGRV